MTIEFHCPHCATFLSTPDERAGYQAKCPGCAETISVPDAPANSSQETTGDPENTDSSQSELPERDHRVTKLCPACGASVNVASANCEFCGARLSPASPRPQATARTRTALRPHRGVLILTLGLVSLLFCVPMVVVGPVAWMLANEDLREMAAGRMDPEGESITVVGKVCGMIATALIVLIPLGICLIGLLAAL